MEDEKTLTPLESMEVIVRTISRTKDNIRANSFYFLLWGWLIAIASFAFFVLGVYFEFRLHFVPFTYTLLLAGIGTLTSGLVMKFRPLMFGGVIFLVASLASVYVATEYKSLLQGIAVVAGYLVPGYLLKNTED